MLNDVDDFVDGTSVGCGVQSSVFAFVSDLKVKSLGPLPIQPHS